MIRKIVYAIVIFSIIWAQQRPPASATRRPPASATQRPPANITQRAPSGQLTSLKDLDFEILKLSYIQTDRALAILKTLGYSAVSYTHLTLPTKA